MTELTIHTARSAPEASREALGRLERTIGFIPNLAGTIAGSPTALQGFVAMQSALRGTAELDARLHALHAFTRRILSEHGHVAEGDLAAFERAGYSVENVLEVITQIAYTTLANLVASVADTPVDDAFAAQAWSAAPA